MSNHTHLARALSRKTKLPVEHSTLFLANHPDQETIKGLHADVDGIYERNRAAGGLDPFCDELVDSMLDDYAQSLDDNSSYAAQQFIERLMAPEPRSRLREYDVQPG